MQMAIQCRVFELTEGLYDHSSKRLASSLSHSTTRIGRVIVRLNMSIGQPWIVK